MYVPVVRTGDLLFLSGAGPVRADGSVVAGKVGRDLDIDEARQAARLVGLQHLAVLRAELGSLDAVKRVVKTARHGELRAGLQPHPAGDRRLLGVFVEVFGDAGRGARSAVGMAELPFDIAVEIEVIVEVNR